MLLGSKSYGSSGLVPTVHPGCIKCQATLHIIVSCLGYNDPVKSTNHDLFNDVDDDHQDFTRTCQTQI